MKKFLTIASFLLILLTNCSPLYQVKTRPKKQQTPSTCWAASLAQIANTYKNVNINECVILNTLNIYFPSAPFVLDCCSVSYNNALYLSYQNRFVLPLELCR